MQLGNHVAVSAVKVETVWVLGPWIQIRFFLSNVIELQLDPVRGGGMIGQVRNQKRTFDSRRAGS
ncbi:MAG: hypothetical protein CMO61_05525 [Verrucomicrobiales bacterium]|jgi:hypothetical protein|nr:hypothetical protein [Verrucomicrobiales bacterium]